MTTNDKKAVGYFFLISILIVVISLLCGSARGASPNKAVGKCFTVVDLNGRDVYRGRLDKDGRFQWVTQNGADLCASSVQWDTLEGYQYRSDFQYARLAILRSILPNTTKTIGQARSRLAALNVEYWNAEHAVDAATNDTDRNTARRRRIAIREEIRAAEQSIYKALPAIYEAVSAGDLDAELKLNGVDHDFGVLILKGAVDSVKKIGDTYKPADKSDSAREA